MDKDTLIGAIKLIRDEFSGTAVQEFKALTPQDRSELASAIARIKGFTQAEVNFPLVAY